MYIGNVYDGCGDAGHDAHGDDDDELRRLPPAERESIVSASLAVPTFAESADLAGWVCINV